MKHNLGVMTVAVIGWAVISAGSGCGAGSDETIDERATLTTAINSDDGGLTMTNEAITSELSSLAAITDSEVGDIAEEVQEELGSGELVAETGTDDYGNDQTLDEEAATRPDRVLGFLRGHWHKKDESDDGNPRGKLGKIFARIRLYRNGLVDAYLRGHYGVNRKGDNVVFAKILDLNGNFLGLFKGGYGFKGRLSGAIFKMVNGSRTRIGAIKAHKVDRPAENLPDDVGGVFRGRIRIKIGDGE